MNPDSKTPPAPPRPRDARDDDRQAGWQADLRLAHELADAADRHSLTWFRKPLAVQSKSDQSPVTRADLEAEAAMRTLLAHHCPDDGIYGEEAGQERLQAERVWVLDPIDGTRSFITGSPLWGTLIGLLQGGRLRLGMIDLPVLHERWVGRPGTGAWCNGRPVVTRRCDRLEDARIVTTSPDLFQGVEVEAFEALSRRCHMRRFGGDCYGYAQLAGGGIDLVLEADLKPYDFLGPAAVIEGAGGVVTDWEGRPLGLGSDGRVLAAGSLDLHRQALDVLRATLHA